MKFQSESRLGILRFLFYARWSVPIELGSNFRKKLFSKLLYLEVCININLTLVTNKTKIRFHNKLLLGMFVFYSFLVAKRSWEQFQKNIFFRVVLPCINTGISQR